MVRKLFKHEIMAYLRVWLPMQIILMSIALLGRIIQFFESETSVYGTVQISSIVTYVIAIIVSIVLISIFAITRFYKNLFTAEGYLSFTLPVTPTQHILIKALTAVLFEVGTFISILVSVAVITMGEVFVEVVKAGLFLLGEMGEALGVHLPFYALEIIIAALAAIMAELMFFYTCIAIGQLFRKNRALAAVGVYFVFYMAFQIIATVVIAFVSVLYDQIYESILRPLERLFQAHPYPSVHVILCAVAVLYLIYGGICFAVTKYIVKNRLNLE